MKKTYSTGTGPICPYCGHENQSQGSDYWAEEMGEGTVDCDECTTPYSFSVDYTTHYYANAIDTEEGGAGRGPNKPLPSPD